MLTARIKKKINRQDGKKRGVSMKRSKAGTKKRSPDGLSLLNQYTIMVAFNKIWKKHNEIQNNIKQNGLEQSEH